MDYLGHQKIVATVSLIVTVILLSLTLSSYRSNHKQVNPAILTKDVSSSIKQGVANMDSLSHFSKSDLLNEEYAAAILSWIGEKSNWKRIFSGKEDAMTPESFHSIVDNKGPIIHIVEDDGNNLFGAYSSVGFDSTKGNGIMFGDNHHFLFTLKNPYSIPPTQFLNKEPRFCISYVDVYGPSYGSHGDLTFRGHDGHFCESHSINFPWSYEDPTGKGNLIFTGKEKFCVQNMEVFIRESSV